MRFQSTVELGGKTATGIPVPDSVVEALGSSRRPAVAVTVGGYTYRTTAARMGGQFFVPLSAENRAAAGVAAGDDVDVDIVIDDQPREIEVPDDLAAAMDPAVREHFDTLSFSQRKEWARWVSEAKQPQTRANRIESTVAALREGKRAR